MGDEVLELLAEKVRAGTPCVLATVVRCDPPTSAKPGDKAVISADGRLEGWIGGSCSEPLVRREALLALADGSPRLVKIVPADLAKVSRKRGELTMATTCPSGGALDIFIEPQLPRPLLIAFGETPAARTLARMAELAGFRSRVVAQHELGSMAAPGADAWSVVATMGHYDEEAIAAALAHQGLDIYLVASRRRAAAVVEGLRARGIPEDSLGRVRPAGRVRGANQEEIALLALAELVTERRRRGHGVQPATAEQAAAVFATDPVCGMAVEIRAGAITGTGPDGMIQYFCCEGCRTQFLAKAAL